LSFLVTQEFGTFMQKSRRKVIDIHKYKFFLLGWASTGQRVQYLDPSRIFFAHDLPGQGHVATPT